MTRIVYIVTAGGTRELIDDVRYIGNISTGRLGACIADKAYSRGHKVFFVHGVSCCLPSCSRKISLEEYTSSSELKEILKRRVSNAESPSVLIHAAAVSDYIPVRSEGKIPSDKGELVVRFKKAEKIVDFIKTWNPQIQLVKFKLESNRTEDELKKIGREAARSSKADWIVVNDTRWIGQETHRVWIIKTDGSCCTAQGKENIATTLVEETERQALSS